MCYRARTRLRTLHSSRKPEIDITSHRSKHADKFAGRGFDYVLTVRDNAKESDPVFFRKATRLHHRFNSPAAVEGSEEKRIAAFRQVRDELRSGALHSVMTWRSEVPQEIFVHFLYHDPALRPWTP